MKITVIKTFEAKPIVTAELNVRDVEDLIKFATSLGVKQNLEDYVMDFEASCDRTYIVGLEHAN
jgi:hypothetical protein